LSGDQQNGRNLEAVERRNIQLEEEAGHLREVLSGHSDSSMRIQSDSLQVVWGKLRDILINDQEKCATEEFIHLYCISININWPIRDVDVFCFDVAELRVTDAIATHVTTLSNWSLDEPFQRRYPERVK
jgi:hypothetical protein